MEAKERARMIRRRNTLQRQLTRLGPIMRGSVVMLGIQNKKSYFSLNKDYKTQLIYLGKKRIKIARQYSANYHKLLEIVEEMTAINMALLKESDLYIASCSIAYKRKACYSSKREIGGRIYAKVGDTKHRIHERCHSG